MYEDIILDGMIFRIVGDTVLLEKYTQNDAEILKIPSKITYEGKTYSVTEIMYYAFLNMGLNLKKVIIPNSITKIGYLAFKKLEKLEKVEFESNSKLNVIREYAFSFLKNLEEFNIPESVNIIYHNAFKDSTKISKIYIPKNLTQIGSLAFFGMTNLREIVCDLKNPNYSSIDGVLFSKKNDNIIFYPPNKLNENYIIPEETKKIDICAFSHSRHLKTINIPNSVAEINYKAFQYANNLIKLIFDKNEGVPNIKELVFKDANVVKEIMVNDNGKPRRIGYCSFKNLKSLERINLPKSIEEIHSDTFKGAINLKEVDFESGSELKNIGDHAFQNVKSLERIKLPKKLEYIGDFAFFGADNLKIVEFEEDSIIERKFDELRKKYSSIPNWLMSVIEDENKFQQEIPLREILQNSLYYPCSLRDILPLDYFGGEIFSYVYVDIGENKRNHLSWIKSGLKRMNTRGRGNYTLINAREVKFSDIVPIDWEPSILPNENDGDIESLQFWQNNASHQFAYWSIWKRNDIKSFLGYKPKYFSLLYLGGSEMNAVYQGLYNRLKMKPMAISIMNPGMGFWDCKTVNGQWVSHSFFEKVLRDNDLGLPNYMIGHVEHSVFFKYYEIVQNDFGKYVLK